MQDNENKSPEVLHAERVAEELERRIVRFKNIDGEKFTHSFRGISISVDAGAEYVGRFPECDHLATHLARKILSRNKKKDLPKTKSAQLWSKKEVEDLKRDILTELGEQSTQSMTPEQARQADSARLEKEFAPSPPKPVPAPAPIAPPAAAAKVTKKQVIDDLKSRGIEPDITKSKEELLEQLTELEMQGVVPKDEE